VRRWRYVRPARRLLLSQRVTVLVALAIVVGGCGASADPLHQVVEATAKTLALPGTTYTMTFGRAQPFHGALNVLGGRAAYDFRAGLGYEALSLEAKDGSSRTLYLDFLPAAAYVAPSPAPAGSLPPGKTWISVALGAKRVTSGTLAAQLAGLAPELLLDEIAWGARSASPAGSSVVGHVPMSRYLVSVDLAKALRAARLAGRPALVAAIMDELQASKSGRVALEAWVNGPGYVAKVKGPVPGSGLGTPTFAFSSFTAKFTPSQVPASDTVTLTSLRPSSRSLWAIALGS
jgi:hypothetical protein